MRSVTSHVTQAYRSSPFRGNRVAPMRRGSRPNELFSRRFDRRTLRMTDIAAGTVVTAPTAISAAPITRRRSAVNRSDISKPTPTPSAARVVTMNPNVGRSSRTFFIATPWSNGGWRKPAAKSKLADTFFTPADRLHNPKNAFRYYWYKTYENDNNTRPEACIGFRFSRSTARCDRTEVVEQGADLCRGILIRVSSVVTSFQ